MSVKAIDTLLAIKVLNVIDGLTATDRQVGVALIEHYNRRTGRCDPSNRRIAELLRISTRTVMRSTKRLESAGLFVKVRHGGHWNTNGYTPNWRLFADSHEAWTRKFFELGRSCRTIMSPPSGQSCHVDGDTSGIQTCIDNLQKQPQLARQRKPREPTFTAVATKLVKGSTSSSIAAQTAAERRWSDDLLRQFRTTPITYGEVIDAITPEIRLAAIEAESRKPGSGIGYILSTLKMED